MTTLTAQQITQSFVDPANNSSINDPLKLAVAVTLQLNVALGNVVKQQALLTEQKSSEMSDASDAMSDLNGALGRLQDSADTDLTYVGKQSSDEPDAVAEYKKLVAAGVDPNIVVINYIGNNKYEVKIDKVSASTGAKNVQIQLDKLGGAASNDQLYMSNFTGKYNTNTDQISSYIKANFDQMSGILRNTLVS
jgi:hypothetical protein